MFVARKSIVKEVPELCIFLVAIVEAVAAGTQVKKVFEAVVTPVRLGRITVSSLAFLAGLSSRSNINIAWVPEKIVH